MPDTGWVKLWRKSLDRGWLTNPKLWTFWCYCLLKATHKEMDQIVGYQTVHLMPGDFVFGRKHASEELEMSERSIRTCLDFLKIAQNVTIKTTNKFSIISIINWHTYQDNQPATDQQNDQPPTSHRPATDHKQEYKELKNVKNKSTNILADISCQGSSPDDALKIDYQVIFDYLNQKTGKHYRVTEKYRAQIRARFSEGFTQDNFFRVIDNMVTNWDKDPEMKQFLRPATLFGTKFDGYLNTEPKLSFADQARKEWGIIE